MERPFHTRFSFCGTLAASVLFWTTFAAGDAIAAERSQLFTDAIGHWRLGDVADSASPPLKAVGAIKTGVTSSGVGAIPDAAAARLASAYFDAGRKLGVRGEAVTVYLRARDPRGGWNQALLAKRGGHDVVNYNLYSVVMGGGPVIGFEVKTDKGFFGVNFPVSRLADPAAWHDIVGRYDGKRIEVIVDGKVFARQPAGGALHQNDEPMLIGAETDAGKITRLFTGDLEEASLWARALSDEELSKLMRVEKIDPGPLPPEPYASPIHYRPAGAILADTIPFFWHGVYHVFYLSAGHGPTPWEHISSTDLVHWKEHPTALPPGRPDEPDGGNVFTGSVLRGNDGQFHIFYTGFNPTHPGGREQIMHAASPDLETWTKHPADTFGADGVHYKAKDDFRDAFVFFNEAEKRYWMLLCTRDAKKNNAPCTGVAVSTDLKKWEQVDPLTGGTPGTPECPDLFQIGDTWYLIFSPSAGSTVYRYSKTGIRGPYLDPDSNAIDTPILYAAKRMFDGKRHILTGWLRDLERDVDGGGYRWGGTQSLPREAYAGPGGELFFRPAAEAFAPFQHEILSLESKPALTVKTGRWEYRDGALKGSAGDGRLWFDAPDNYLLTLQSQIGAKSALTIGLRTQADAAGSGAYELVIDPSRQSAEIRGPGFSFKRRCPMEADKPFTVHIFLQGTLIEAFIDGKYAFSARAYNFRKGSLTLKAEGGDVVIQSMNVKSHLPAKATAERPSVPK